MYISREAETVLNGARVGFREIVRREDLLGAWCTRVEVAAVRRGATIRDMSLIGFEVGIVVYMVLDG